jgi:hypothetical protein
LSPLLEFVLCDAEEQAGWSHAAAHRFHFKSIDDSCGDYLLLNQIPIRWI